WVREAAYSKSGAEWRETKWLWTSRTPGTESPKRLCRACSNHFLRPSPSEKVQGWGCRSAMESSKNSEGISPWTAQLGSALLSMYLSPFTARLPDPCCEKVRR